MRVTVSSPKSAVTMCAIMCGMLVCRKWRSHSKNMVRKMRKMQMTRIASMSIILFSSPSPACPACPAADPCCAADPCWPIPCSCCCCCGGGFLEPAWRAADGSAAIFSRQVGDERRMCGWPGHGSSAFALLEPAVAQDGEERRMFGCPGHNSAPGSRRASASDDAAASAPSCLRALSPSARGTNAVELQRSSEDVAVPFCCTVRSAELHSMSRRRRRRVISASIISRLIVSTKRLAASYCSLATPARS